jgi:glycosyltransferase involved in cell wall biosynthesis
VAARCYDQGERFLKPTASRIKPSLISFIVPAHNEEFWLGRTLTQIVASADAWGKPYEVIVVDDASTDRTGEVARAHGAKLVRVELRQIAAVRNAGARAASGDTFVFVDADTLVPPTTLAQALTKLDSREAVGGGAWVGFDGEETLSLRLFAAVILYPMRLFGWAAGCFIFVRRDAFEAIGGFDERYFASEELHLSRALKTQGRFVLVRAKVVTSGRKAKMNGIWRHTFATLGRMLIRGPRALQQREGLDIWYAAPRKRLNDEHPA